MPDERAGGLAAWQWREYPRGHHDRRNLAIHLLTAPCFGPSFIGFPFCLALGMWPAAIGCAVGIVTPILAQSFGHRLEQNAPIPFRGPLDVVSRLLLEQLVTFPRFVFSGEFARAWRQAR